MKSYLSEFIGTALLLAIIAGSGIMGETLGGGNDAVALLGNSIATGAGLYVLITLLGPISGAHFNPVVSLMFWKLGHIDKSKMVAACHFNHWDHGSHISCHCEEYSIEHKIFDFYFFE